MSHSYRIRHRDSSSPDLSPHKRSHISSPTRPAKRLPTFPSYLDVPDLHPKIHLLCEIVAKSAAVSVESSLDESGVLVSADDVEEVLKLTYAFPATATKFFCWAGNQIHDQHSPYGWNLLVDLLGKNLLFDDMWDAVKVMRRQRIVSLATFASIFSSYAAADRFDDSFMSFEVMDQYGVPLDVMALNSLLSAVCRHGKTKIAWNFLSRARKTITPDADSYAILLEGWENEGDSRNAIETFAEMVGVIGWHRSNVPAYDSFLSTLACGPGGLGEAMKHLAVIRDKGCLPGMKFFRISVEELLKRRDVRGATAIWDMMAWKNGNRPNLSLYNDMIALRCYLGQIDAAYKLIDEMVIYGLLPDSNTYNSMLKVLLKDRNSKDVAIIFTEMLKNECAPSHENCRTAFKLFLDLGDTKMMVNVWKCMVNNKMYPLEENGNLLVLKLRDIDMLPEACKHAEHMAERGIKVHSSTLSKLRTSLSKLGKENLYFQLLQKWKLH